jgi:hypothetical protein
MTGTQRLAAAAATMLLLVSASAPPVAAQILCSAPIAPFCAESDSTFSDEGTTERCRQDVAAFATQVDEYAACLDQKIADLRNEQQALQESFDCRAQGGEDCPAPEPAQ